MNVSLIADVATPRLLLHRPSLRSNHDRMVSAISKKGVYFRPHMKTAKSLDVARLVTKEQFGGIAVSTLREASFFGANGLTDVLYTVPIAPQKFSEVERLLANGINLKVLVDSAEIAAKLTEHFKGPGGCPLDVLIEVDVGEGRCGVDPTDGSLAEIAGVLSDARGLRLAGVLGHGGQSYSAESISAICEIAEAERELTTAAAATLRAHGLACGIVSIGCTPTALFSDTLTGVTEVRAGVYMFGDLFQFQIGSCSIDEIAISVLATVVGHRKHSNELIIDAGALALSKDRSTQTQARDFMFGLCVRLGDPVRDDGPIVTKVYQEHGIVKIGPSETLDCYPIGSQLRILPNHACMTAAMHDRYVVTDDYIESVSEWERINGW